MRVLVTNDDGVDAPGILCLAEHLRQAKHSVVTVAPERDRSGASHALTLDRPVRVKRIDIDTYRVTGTPVDCVHLALNGLLDSDPDLVVSGINSTANLGDDVLYSGTVGAAMEGRCLGTVALAVSLASLGTPAYHYVSAARAVVELLAHLADHPLPAQTILNLNVPDVAWESIQGYRVATLGSRQRPQPCVAQTDPRGHRIHWIGESGAVNDGGPRTDFHAVQNRYIAVTPLRIDLTHEQAMEDLTHWGAKLKFATDQSL